MYLVYLNFNLINCPLGETVMEDKELEKFYRAFEEMFRTDGWKNLLSDLSQNNLHFFLKLILYFLPTF